MFPIYLLFPSQKTHGVWTWRSASMAAACLQLARSPYRTWFLPFTRTIRVLSLYASCALSNFWQSLTSNKGGFLLPEWKSCGRRILHLPSFSSPTKSFFLLLLLIPLSLSIQTIHKGTNPFVNTPKQTGLRLTPRPASQARAFPKPWRTTSHLKQDSSAFFALFLFTFFFLLYPEEFPATVFSDLYRNLRLAWSLHVNSITVL
ncbi:hypothetical protein FIM1_4242 [Kluyveromyces marxianus]|uniref:Uncharacterized protein n=1 Tax=Kluyveromyces marxianus TaxID=4911 RepID=A0ABX6F0Y0_KLUMA|nr:hypothetical protein FIM1_4242 [Kluyveromyces marxianus]